MNTRATLAWLAAVALAVVQWAPVPGSAFIVTVAIRVPAVRDFLPARALALIELADLVSLALRTVRFFRTRFA